MKPDITSRQDIELLVNSFYDKVRINPLLGPIFEDIVKINWQEHLPRMYDFWAAIALGEQGFSGNPMQKHIELSRLATLSSSEFSEWLLLFDQTVDELFEGEKASAVKIRARNIANLMLHKIQTKGKS